MLFRFGNARLEPIGAILRFGQEAVIQV